MVIPFWDLCLDVERTINFLIIFADIDQVGFEDLLFFYDLAAYRCRTCLPLVVSLHIIQPRVRTSRATWTSGRRSCCRFQRFDFRRNDIYILNKSRSLTSKNGIPKVNKRDFFSKTCSTSLHVLLFLQMANSQENTVPALEAASATVEDVGSGLVGDFVARCWITWFLFEEVWFVNNTFERVDWLPLATPCSNDEICQDDISRTRQSGISAKQR